MPELKLYRIILVIDGKTNLSCPLSKHSMIQLCDRLAAGNLDKFFFYIDTSTSIDDIEFWTHVEI